MNTTLVAMNAGGLAYALSEGGGYNPLSAIFELVDNSFKEEVNASFCSISFEFDNTGNLKKIFCADDGISMNEDDLMKFFSYGERTQNEGKITSLSKYGIGGKAASLYLGDNVTIYCMPDGYGKIIKKTFNSCDFVGSSLKICNYTDDDITVDEVNMFNDMVKCGHGTLFVIDSLKRRTKEALSLNRINGTKETIRPIRVAYSRLLRKTGKKLFFNNNDIKPLNYFGGINKVTKEPFSGTVLGEEVIKINGYNDMKLVCVHCTRDFDGNYVYDMPPTERKHSGLHIFRNDRCITPEGLDGHVFTADTHHGQGFRAFLFCDGSHDELFGNTFNKTVTTDDNFNEELIKVLKPKLTKYSNQSVTNRREEGRALAVKANVEFDVMIKDMLNKVIKNFKYVRKSKTKYNQLNDSKKDNKKIGLNKTTPKRTELTETIGNVTSINGGINGNFCEIYLENGKYSVNLNVDHPLYLILRQGNTSNYNILGIILIKLSERIALDEALKEDENVAKKLSRYYDNINESSETILHNLFKDYSYLYEDNDEYETIDDFDGCIGVCLSYEDLKEKDKLELIASEPM